MINTEKFNNFMELIKIMEDKMYIILKMDYKDEKFKRIYKAFDRIGHNLDLLPSRVNVLSVYTSDEDNKVIPTFSIYLLDNYFMMLKDVHNVNLLMKMLKHGIKIQSFWMDSMLVIDHSEALKQFLHRIFNHDRNYYSIYCDFIDIVQNYLIIYYFQRIDSSQGQYVCNYHFVLFDLENMKVEYFEKEMMEKYVEIMGNRHDLPKKEKILLFKEFLDYVNMAKIFNIWSNKT